MSQSSQTLSVPDMEQPNPVLAVHVRMVGLMTHLVCELQGIAHQVVHDLEQSTPVRYDRGHSLMQHLLFVTWSKRGPIRFDRGTRSCSICVYKKKLCQQAVVCDLEQAGPVRYDGGHSLMQHLRSQEERCMLKIEWCAHRIMMARVGAFIHAASPFAKND
eukprot:1158977-Pelagomonas_calceolata.AAC.6